MEYRILRNEKRKDKDGNDEIFLQVEIEDGNEIYSRAEWLAPSEVAQVMANEKAIDGIAEKMANRGMKTRPAQIAQASHDKEMHIAQAKSEAARLALEASKFNNNIA